MRGIIKALILGWIGKKIYDRVTDDEETESAAKDSGAKRPPAAAHHRSSPSRARKTSRKAA